MFTIGHCEGTGCIRLDVEAVEQLQRMNVHGLVLGARVVVHGGGECGHQLCRHYAAHKEKVLLALHIWPLHVGGEGLAEAFLLSVCVCIRSELRGYDDVTRRDVS